MKKRALFLCTGNAARSQMAAGLANHDFGDRLEAFSAGVNPAGVSEFAIKALDEIGIDISHETSDHLSRYEDQLFDYVITVCDNADKNCPVFFGGVKRLHMPFPDPPHRGRDEEVMPVYREVRDTIRRRLREFFSRELQR